MVLADICVPFADNFVILVNTCGTLADGRVVLVNTCVVLVLRLIQDRSGSHMVFKMMFLGLCNKSYKKYLATALQNPADALRDE